MTTNDFLSTESLESEITNRKTDTNDEKINYLNFFFVKCNIADPTWQEINIFKKASRGRPCSSKAMFSSMAKWERNFPAKNEDLKSMLSLIPRDAKPFYRKYFEDPSVCDDIGGFNADLDFEIDFYDV